MLTRLEDFFRGYLNQDQDLPLAVIVASYVENEESDQVLLTLGEIDILLATPRSEDEWRRIFERYGVSLSVPAGYSSESWVARMREILTHEVKASFVI